MTDTATGIVYSDIGTGAFAAEDGTELLPGWQVIVGFDNYVGAFTEQSIRGPFFYVLVWTFVFADPLGRDDLRARACSSRSSSTTRG